MMSLKDDFCVEKPLFFPAKELEKEKPKKKMFEDLKYDDVDQSELLELMEHITIYNDEDNENLGNLIYEISYYQAREKDVSNPFMNKDGPVLKEHDENYENLLSMKECSCLLLHCEKIIYPEKIKKDILLTPFDFLCQEHKIIVNEKYMKNF